MIKKAISPSMERLYRCFVDLRLIAGTSPQSEVAELLIVSPQNVAAWEKRGVSEKCALEVQRTYQINAVWLLFGEGSVRIQSGEARATTALMSPPADRYAADVQSVDLLQRAKRGAAAVQAVLSVAGVKDSMLGDEPSLTALFVTEMSHGYTVEHVTSPPEKMTYNLPRQEQEFGASDLTLKIGRRNNPARKKADGGKPSDSQ